MSSSSRIFLASSSELAAERAAIEIRVNRINKAWQPEGIFLHLEIWEDFIGTVSRTSGSNWPIPGSPGERRKLTLVQR